MKKYAFILVMTFNNYRPIIRIGQGYEVPITQDQILKRVKDEVKTLPELFPGRREIEMSEIWNNTINLLDGLCPSNKNKMDFITEQFKKIGFKISYQTMIIDNGTILFTPDHSNNGSLIPDKYDIA